MQKYEIAANLFAAKGNENIAELFVCSDGEAYELESRALDHAREHGAKFLGGVTRKEIESELGAEELAKKEAEEKAAKEAKEAEELAKKEAEEKAAKEAKEAEELAKKEAEEKAAKEAKKK